MTSLKARLPFLAGLICFCSLIPVARADSFGFYNSGTFQFDANTISGNAEGLCSGQCAPWGDIVILDVSFAASVIDYQQSVSCSNNQCETEIRGDFGPGSLTAGLAVYDDSWRTYYLSSSSLQGSFSSRFCTGHCATYRAETDLSLTFQGDWNNNWSSNGTIQMVCFHNMGCSDGTGAGSLTTATPEPSAVALLLGNIPCLCFAMRKKLF
jgi:hypothetical protein